jgi:sulfite reductase (ferredoxin)
VPYFMVRIRIPNGLLTTEQLRTIAWLSAEHGNGVADVTVRQNIQLHWVKIESLPVVFERLGAVGLTTVGACGDVARNVTGCPLAGIHAHEIADVSSIVKAIDKELGGNPEFYNLPRKFKISATGCPDWCSYPEINDIGLTATRRIRDGREEIGFSLRVAGGLSTEPHLAVRLNAFVKWEQVIPVVRAVTEVFRTADVLRQSRDKARLKFLFLEHREFPGRDSLPPELHAGPRRAGRTSQEYSSRSSGRAGAETGGIVFDWGQRDSRADYASAVAVGG